MSRACPVPRSGESLKAVMTGFISRSAPLVCSLKDLRQIVFPSAALLRHTAPADQPVAIGSDRQAVREIWILIELD
jgi:hypothetical protein